jgi:hypothetical protein
MVALFWTNPRGPRWLLGLEGHTVGPLTVILFLSTLLYALVAPYGLGIAALIMYRRSRPGQGEFVVESPSRNVIETASAIRPCRGRTMERLPNREGGGEIWYQVAVVAGVMFASAWAQMAPAGKWVDMSTHLGGEYRCIAEALADGRGFSDPFGIPTGPTAWMPPVLPALMAVMLTSFGSIDAVAAAVITLQNVVLIYMGYIVLGFASGPGTPRGSRLVAIAAYAMIVAYNYFYYFSFTHDHVLVGLWICLFVDLTDRLWGKPPRPFTIALWAVAGGLSALTSPVLGLVWAALTVMLAVAARRVRWFVAPCAITCLLVAPWVARNAVIFHRFIPVKSNLAFELYQSQCLEKDGVLRFATFVTHPFRNIEGGERQLYMQQGEMEYLNRKRRAFLESVRKDPGSYARRVANRLVAATVAFDTYFGDAPVVVLAQRIVHPLPFAGLILTLSAHGWSRDRRKITCLVIYIVYMLPYVMVSYYSRYVVPLDIVKTLFCVWGWQAVRSCVPARFRAVKTASTRCAPPRPTNCAGQTTG